MGCYTDLIRSSNGKVGAQRMRRQIVISLLLVVVLLAVGAGAAALLVRTAPQPPTNPAERPALLVRGLELEPQTMIAPRIM